MLISATTTVYTKPWKLCTTLHTRSRALFAMQMEQSCSPILYWISDSVEHSRTLFSTAHTVKETTLKLIAHKPVKIELDKPAPFSEIRKIYEQLKKDKGTGIDDISSEIWKYDSCVLYCKVCELLCRQERGKLLLDFRDSVTITIHKTREELPLNYPAFGLWEDYAKKICSFRSWENLNESQCGFWAGRGTANIDFVLR